MRTVATTLAMLIALADVVLNPFWVWLVHGEQPPSGTVAGGYNLVKAGAGELVLLAEAIRALAETHLPDTLADLRRRFGDRLAISTAFQEGDVALIDIKLPDGSGIDLITKIKRNMKPVQHSAFDAALCEEGVDIVDVEAAEHFAGLGGRWTEPDGTVHTSLLFGLLRWRRAPVFWSMSSTSRVSFFSSMLSNETEQNATSFSRTTAVL